MSRSIIRRKPKRKQRTIKMRCTNVYESGTYDNRQMKFCTSDLHYKYENNVKITFVCKRCGICKETYK
jgi:hypothetical protein